MLDVFSVYEIKIDIFCVLSFDINGWLNVLVFIWIYEIRIKIYVIYREWSF